MALSQSQLAQLWTQAGGNPKYALLMAKIAGRESGGNPGAQNLNAGTGDHSIGLWQINQLAHHGRFGSDQALQNPLTNARAAVALFKASKNAGVDPLSPWSTHNAATDAKFIGQDAQAASAAAAGSGSPSPSLAPQAAQASPQAGQQRAALISQYLSNEHDPSALTGLASGLQALKPVAVPTHQIVPVTGKQGTSPITAPGSAPDNVRTLIERANQIDAKHYNYEWGGGHNTGLTPGHGIGHGSGPGVGFDCSAAVSKVLGINARVASEFMGWGAPGKGKSVTIYAKGSHVLMEINGHFFGTSGSNPGGGAGWIPASALPASYLSGFVARHPTGM